MTVEELKAEAAKLGYNIIKKQEPIKLSPCVCGHKERNLWYSNEDKTCFYRCKCCDFAGYKAKTKRQAKIQWNEAIEQMKEISL